MHFDHSACASHANGSKVDQPIVAGDLSRRRLLRAGMLGTAAGLFAGLGAGFGGPRAALAADPETPDAALQELIDGNARYVAGDLLSWKIDVREIRQKVVDQGPQRPFAAVLSCADSRAPVEWIFDQVIGKVFVTRVAGNIATAEIIASLEYGVRVLGTKVIVVLGHGDCGAVKAAIANKRQPGQISALFAPIRPAIDQAGTDLDAAIKANAEFQASLLREASPLLAKAVGEGTLNITSGVYNLTTGAVAFDKS